MGGRGGREDRGGGDVRGQRCEEAVDRMKCCESLGKRVGTHGDGTRSWHLGAHLLVIWSRLQGKRGLLKRIFR